ncbi:MAG TPA: hypothetical protein VGA04_23905, partial [Streptosporangiaceae bacterium]
ESGQTAALLRDPGFVLQPDPAILVAALDGEFGDVYRASVDISAHPPKVNRAALALNAVRVGLTDLADTIATVPGQPVLTSTPRT